MGSTQIRICKDGKIVLEEPAVVAVDVRNGRVLAAGNECLVYFGRLIDYIQNVRPIKNGQVVDYGLFEQMMIFFRKERLKKHRPIRWALVAVSDQTMENSDELRALEESLKMSFAHEVHFIGTSAALAIEMGLVDKSKS